MAKQVRAARHYQDRTAPLRRLADAGIAPIKRDLKVVFDSLPELIPDNAEEHARNASWEELKDAIGWPHLRGMLREVFGQVGKVREAGAQFGVKQINQAFARAGKRVRYRKGRHGVYTSVDDTDKLFDANAQAWHGAAGRDWAWRGVIGSGTAGLGSDETVVGKDVGDRFFFDMFDESVQQELRQAQDSLIAELETDIRDAIDEIILDGATQGLGPEEIMDNIRDLIGLTARQSRAVENYREMLTSLDPGALERQLRNFMEDDVVQAALDAGQPMDAAMVDKLVSDYADNFLDYRAEMIAQTESTRAVNLGLQDAYSQAIDRGVFPADAVTQFWQVALDEKTCEICLSIPDMNPDGVGMDEAFQSIDGDQDAPPDPHPNCRCSLQIVTDLDMLPAEEEAA